MLTVTLNNGLEMPMLGLGVFRIDNNNPASQMVRAALEAGYRSIDTAAVYGNEEAVGEGIRQSAIPRESIFLTTKVWNEVQRSGNVQQAFEESLERLGVDYVDLYLIHWPVPEKYTQTWLELEKIYAQGKAKAIGVSNFNIRHLEDIKALGGLIPVINQVEYHPLLTQKPLLSYCQKEKIQLEAWSPLGAAKNGLLDHELMVSLAKKYSKTPAQIILRWDIDTGVVTIPKSAHLERIKENLDVFDFELTAEDVAAIDALNQDQRVGSDPETFNF